MKYAAVLFQFLAILAISFPVQANWYAVIARKKAAAGGGETLKQSTGGAGGSGYASFITSDKVYISSQFTASSSYTLTSIVVSLSKNNSPTGNVTAYIYSDSSGSPGSVVATSTGTLDLSTVLSGFNDYTFNFSGYGLTGSTVYHVVLGKTTGAVNAANYVNWEYAPTGGGGIEKDDDGTAPFTSIGAAYHAVIDFYGT